MSVVVAGQGEGTGELFFQGNDHYSRMVEALGCMLHQQGDPVVQSHFACFCELYLAFAPVKKLYIQFFFQ